MPTFPPPSDFDAHAVSLVRPEPAGRRFPLVLVPASKDFEARAISIGPRPGLSRPPLQRPQALHSLFHVPVPNNTPAPPIHPRPLRAEAVPLAHVPAPSDFEAHAVSMVRPEPAGRRLLPAHVPAPTFSGRRLKHRAKAGLVPAAPSAPAGAGALCKEPHTYT